jgi:hypothetical protein
VPWLAKPVFSGREKRVCCFSKKPSRLPQAKGENPMTLKIPKLSAYLRTHALQKKSFVRDASVGIAFVAAISILLLVAGYVISRLSGERAYREKWKDYNDCGWA